MQNILKIHKINRDSLATKRHNYSTLLFKEYGKMVKSNWYLPRYFHWEWRNVYLVYFWTCSLPVHKILPYDGKGRFAGTSRWRIWALRLCIRHSRQHYRARSSSCSSPRREDVPVPCNWSVSTSVHICLFFFLFLSSFCAHYGARVKRHCLLRRAGSGVHGRGQDIVHCHRRLLVAWDQVCTKFVHT